MKPAATPQDEPEIRELNGKEPHPSYGGWRGFLKQCEVRDTHQGVTYYGSSNCNYIVFPDGTLMSNFGFWGDATMRQIREYGWETVLKNVREELAAIKALLEQGRVTHERLNALHALR